MIKLAAEKRVIPQSLDTRYEIRECSLFLYPFLRLFPLLTKIAHDRTEFGFRCFAGFSLALILYMTEYHPNHLQKGFMSTMTNLYYESNSGSFLPPDLYRFAPVIGCVPSSFFFGLGVPFEFAFSFHLLTRRTL